MESIIEWTRLLSIFSLYILGYLIIKTNENLTRLSKIIIFSVIIPSIFALYQFFTRTGMSIPFEGIYNRIFGTFTHPNLFAYYLIIPIALSLFLFSITKTKKIAKIILAIITIFLSILLILTYTRGAWLAFVIIITFISIACFKKYGKFLIIIFLIISFSYFLIEPINKRINDFIYNPYNSIHWRLNLWKDSLSYVKEKLLFGNGTGTAEKSILQKRGYRFGSTAPHNDYLKITLENGLLGLLSYIFLIISLFFKLLKKFQTTKSQNIKLFSLTLLGITVSLYTLSFADNILRNTALEWSYWILIGAFLASKESE
ncbi:MAG: O-antigen ligase family protein [Patescibacteria group bacterium]